MTQPAQPAHPAHDARGRALGFLQAFLAYGLWGVLVLYFAVLGPASPLEVIGWRILLSVVVAGPALLATGRWGEFTALLRDRRALATFAVAGVLIAANWLSFVWAVSLGHGLEASLGYYLNPLVAVLLGMLVLGERMGPSSGPRSASPAAPWPSSPSRSAGSRGSDSPWRPPSGSTAS